MTTKSLSSLLKGFVLLAAIPAIASAHPGHDGDHGFGWDFSGGFAHPLGGCDHILAMIAVGLWATQLGGRARWLVPAAFVSVMTIGAVLGHGGFEIAGTEQAVAASVLVLGPLVATAARFPVALSITIVGVFSLFHGIAHGAEMPATAAGFEYGLGFVLATTLLHAAGIGIGQVTAKGSSFIPQTAGAAIALVGVAMLTF